jgi:hypothetical protein
MGDHTETPRYYMPYTSDDEETDAGTGTGTDEEDEDEDYDESSLPDYEDARIRREQDPRYAIIRTAGPNLNTSQQQLKYMEHAPGAEYNPSTNITTLQNLVYLNPPKTTITSLFSVKAINRDRRVYPSPFNFEIKLPRVYKNVTKFQLVQLSFPNNTLDAIVTSNQFVSSFVDVLIAKGVDPNCLSTCIDLINGTTLTNGIGVYEYGKVDSNGKQVMTTISIPDGIYTNEKLAAELNTQSNLTPQFNIISYSEFKDIFQTTGDATILFNEPGDIFYSPFTNVYHRNYSKETVMNSYYSQIHLNSITEITDIVTFNAYYYPVLKELLVTNKARPFLNLAGYTYNTIYNNVVTNFQGLNSNDYYTICSSNRGVLDRYRKHLSFEFRGANKYEWNYNSDLHQFRCIHNTLHPSIQRDITTRYNTYLNHQLTLSGLTPITFKTLKTNQVVNKTIYKHMESYLSTVLGQYHLVSGYSYNGGSSHVTNESTFTVAGLHSDAMFTGLFNFSTIFGNQFGTYSGVNLGFSNFLDFHSTMSSFHNSHVTTLTTISSIYKETHDNHHTYISNKYGSIFPTSYMQKKSYNTFNPLPVAFVGGKKLYTAGPGCDTDDCSRECCKAIEQIITGWYSCLPVNTVINSLAYRLGIINFDITNYSIVSTILNASSTNTNYLLQVNNEQSFNNMDIGMPENYDKTNVTVGQVKLMYAKILTGGLGDGEIAQTVIQNPILFETPLGKLDKLQFKIYYDDNQLTPSWLVVPFDIPFADWDATFQIDEEVGFADRNSGWGNNPTVPIPNNPAAMQYLALTEQNNPNNK